MIFNELYSAYYGAVSAIIRSVLNGEADTKALQKNVEKYAFSESVLTVLPSLKKGKWQLMTPDNATPLKNAPTTPLTLLEKRWLKAVTEDDRIKLFLDEPIEGLEDVEPLFTKNDYVVYDKYADGDPYGDSGYISRFKTVLDALREKYPLNIRMLNRQGNTVSVNVMPLHLEYSEKDDKFRLIGANNRNPVVVNMGRVVACGKMAGSMYVTEKTPAKSNVTLRVYDERNALERCMLHFAHFEKRAEKVDNNVYDLHITYNTDDETELVIRVLSFGPMVEVTEPPTFRELIKNRLIKQKSCGL